MRLEHQDLLREFYKDISPLFPGMTLSELNHIVCGPFTHLKKMMEEDKIDNMRLKYFGSFLVHKKKAESELSYLDGRLEKGVISEKQYDRYKKMLTKYLEDGKENF